jgi:cell division protein FtsI/penicillin-binding protein 2
MDRAAPKASSNRRLYIWYGVLFFIFAIIITRLFYLQIIRHDYYQKAALSDQQKQYTIAADRGTIEGQQNSGAVPLVLNEKLYTLYADPTLVKHPSSDAQKIAAIAKGNAADYAALMKTRNSRYVVLGKRLSQSQMNRIAALKLPGVGLQAQDYRTYPQGNLAAQLLGFVNDEGKGTYGIEQALNGQLGGTPGSLKAITDVNGVPLAASRDNVQIAPKPGKDIQLTIDVGMQKQLETYLAQDVKHAVSNQGSALIMDANTGQIKAMANYPSYDPSQYYNVSDSSLFNNAAVDKKF